MPTRAYATAHRSNLLRDPAQTGEPRSTTVRRTATTFNALHGV